MQPSEKILAGMPDAAFWEFMTWAQLPATVKRFEGRDFSDMLLEWSVFEWLRSEVRFN